VIWFLVGFACAWIIQAYRLHRLEEMRHHQIVGIYEGYGAPDAAGRVGWYRDNSGGSPFTDPDSKWGEAGQSTTIETTYNQEMERP
jgi:hypothetical protein